MTPEPDNSGEEASGSRLDANLLIPLNKGFHRAPVGSGGFKEYKGAVEEPKEQSVSDNPWDGEEPL